MNPVINPYAPGAGSQPPELAAVGKAVNALGPLRQSLISKGMLWSPNHGGTAYTVPLFDEFMKRIMPGSEWRKV